MEFFKYFETTNRAERESIAYVLIRMYNGAIDAENEEFALLQACPDSKRAIKEAQKAEFLSASARLGAIQGIFTTLGIEYEPGVKIEIGEEEA